MSKKRQLIVLEQAKSPIAESFRTLRTNIQFAKPDGELKTILFTSAGPGEGKSTITANTALALAQSGRRVILMDCDLRKPVQHKIFGKKNKGLTNALVEDLPVLELLPDMVIIDVPPAIAVTDASVLASRVDGIVLTVSAGMVRPEMAQQAQELLIKANGYILGVVLNRVEIEEEHSYYYYYYGDTQHKAAK